MTLTTTLLGPALVLIAQVGPNPDVGGIQGIPDELLNRPARPTSNTNEIAAPLAPESQWLSDCLDVLAQDAARAHTLAQLQRNETVGPERVLANHCLGLAASELELWTDALTAFGAARDETPVEENRLRSRFGTMAGLSAIAGGDAAGAVVILQRSKQDAALAASAPLQAVAATQLARALVTLGRSNEALAELESATSLQPDSGESWLLKATLLRRMERLSEAQSAIERAGDLAPTDPEVGLEAGVIAVLDGRDDAARASWESVIALAPESPHAGTAQGYLAQLGPSLEAASEESPQEEPS